MIYHMHPPNAFNVVASFVFLDTHVDNSVMRNANVTSLFCNLDSHAVTKWRNYLGTNPLVGKSDTNTGRKQY